MRHQDRDQLLRDHQPARVAHRLARPPAGPLRPDAVLGAIDGCVTTFAIVAGAVGAGFPPVVIKACQLIGVKCVFLVKTERSKLE